MKVYVGSKNRVKIEAVKSAFSKFFEKDVEVIGVSVDNGVGKQPYDEQTWKGAINRAKNAMKEYRDGDFWVGIESGIFSQYDRYFVANCIVVMDKNGNWSFGMSPWFEITKELYERIRKSEEMERVMEELFNIKDIGEKMGAIGVFTKGIMNRKELTEYGVIAALAGYWERKLLEKS